MSDAIDTATETVAPSTTVAPPQGGDPQGSTPASVDTTVPSEAAPQEPAQPPRRDRAFASMRRQINELQRELGRVQGRQEAMTSAPGGGEVTPRSEPSEVDTLRREMAQRDTERTARAFWSSAGKEAKEQGIEGFADARDALQSGDIPTNPAMSHYVTEMADNKAAMVVWLADNPEEAERIAALDPVSAGVELARVDARLSARPVPRKTGAPPPVRTVGGSPSATPDVSKMSTDDFMEWRRKQSA